MTLNNTEDGSVHRGFHSLECFLADAEIEFVTGHNLTFY